MRKILMLLFFMFVLAACSVQNKKASQKPLTSEPTVVTFVTADKSFAFEYLNNWTISENQVNESPNPSQTGYFGGQPLQVWTLTSPDGSLAFSFAQEANPKKPLNQILNCDPPFSCKQVTLNNIQFLSNTDGKRASGLPTNLAVMRDKKVLQIGVIERSGTPEEVKKMYDQVTSTFTFIDENYTGWKTYTDPKYGFSFRYPSEYQVQINDELTTIEYLYLDVTNAEGSRVAEVRVFKGDEDDLSPQVQFVQEKNVLGNNRGNMTYYSNVKGSSFREYIIAKGGYLYLVHWFGDERMTVEEVKFTQSFSFSK